MARKKTVETKDTLDENIILPPIPKETYKVTGTIKKIEEPPVIETPKKHYSDEDILTYALNLMNKAVDGSRQKNFTAVGFTFTDLQLLQQVAAAALDRTKKLNMVLNSIKDRDMLLAKQLGDYFSLVADITEKSQTLKTNYEQIITTTSFFVEKLK